jgi:hypothetical protein
VALACANQHRQCDGGRNGNKFTDFHNACLWTGDYQPEVMSGAVRFGFGLDNEITCAGHPGVTLVTEKCMVALCLNAGDRHVVETYDRDEFAHHKPRSLDVEPGNRDVCSDFNRRAQP